MKPATHCKRRLPRGRATADPVERACAADRQWFADHPGATARIRPHVAGEFGAYEPERPGGFVVVRQIAPGMRTRQHFNPPSATAPDSVFVIARSGMLLQERGPEVWN